MGSTTLAPIENYLAFSGERQLAPTPFYHLVVTIPLVLILAKLLVCIVLFVIWIWINGYSLLKGGLTRIMASKKRTSGTQLLVSVCAIGQTVSEANSGCLERSVRARAILLIMAGDVEENPGPIPANASPESRNLTIASQHWCLRGGKDQKLAILTTCMMFCI